MVNKLTYTLFPCPNRSQKIAENDIPIIPSPTDSKRYFISMLIFKSFTTFVVINNRYLCIVIYFIYKQSDFDVTYLFSFTMSLIANHYEDGGAT